MSRDVRPGILVTVHRVLLLWDFPHRFTSSRALLGATYVASWGAARAYVWRFNPFAIMPDDWPI